MKRKLIYFIALILLMLTTGVFWGTWFTLTRSLESFSSDEFIHIGKVIINNVAIPMRILMPLCILTMLLALWFYRYKKSIGFYLGLTSFILIILTLLITLFILVPIDNEIKGWTSTLLPPQWEYIRDKWKLFHAIRTLTSLLSFGCFSWFILAAMKKNRTINY
jgi:uncharacterized membrane protein